MARASSLRQLSRWAQQSRGRLGRFSFETLPTGLYSLALEKNGLEPVRADGVLVAPGLNDVGPFFMREGAGMVRLDGGPPLPPTDGGRVDAGVPDGGADGGLPDGGDGGDAGMAQPDAGVDAGPPVPEAGGAPLAFVGPPPDVGIIQFENLFYEPRCDGSVLHPQEGTDGAWFAYLDVLEERGSGCTPRDEVVVNTCAEVGYPSGFSGQYVSRRTWRCATNDWSEWTREDSCRASTCVPRPDEVVVNTCAEVGYPSGFSGQYVSRRSWRCDVNDWGPWQREDTCRRR